MAGIITVTTKKGVAFHGSIWEVICLLAFKGEYVLMNEVRYIIIDGQVISRPESMEDDT